MEKSKFFSKIASVLTEQGFDIVKKDDTRPWGGFFVINENQAQIFANHYLDGLNVDLLRISGKLSPKILLVAPNAKLSWQYHHRRAEIWQVVEGTVGIIRSNTDNEGPMEKFNQKSQIRLEKGERHRLVGLEDWGIVAEIWQHTESENPSDEDDIVRLQDDFGR